MAWRRCPLISYPTGFRKVDPDRCEFANEEFLKGQKHLLRNIHRRKSISLTQQNGNVVRRLEAGQYDVVEGEVGRLTREKNVIMHEVVRLRNEQKVAQEEMKLMGERLQATERKQQQMLAFLAASLSSPAFAPPFVQHGDQTKCLRELSKKRILAYHLEGTSDAENPGPSLEWKYTEGHTTSNDANPTKLLHFLNAEADMSIGQLENLIDQIGTANNSRQGLKEQNAPIIQKRAKFKKEDCVPHEANGKVVVESPSSQGREVVDLEVAEGNWRVPTASMTKTIEDVENEDDNMGERRKPHGNAGENWEHLVGTDEEVPDREAVEASTNFACWGLLEEREMTDEWWTRDLCVSQ